MGYEMKSKRRGSLPMVPEPVRIDDLTPQEYQSLMGRSQTDVSSVYERVRNIILDVKSKGEGVFLDYYRSHYKDDLTSQGLEVGKEEIEEAYEHVTTELIDALRYASGNISTFPAMHLP